MKFRQRYKRMLPWIFSKLHYILHQSFPGGSVSKEFACNAEDFLQCRRPRFDPWVEKIVWRRKWQPTPVFLPEKSHGERSLAGYSPWVTRVGHSLATEHHHHKTTTIHSDLCGLRWNEIKELHIIPHQNPPSPLLTVSTNQCFKKKNKKNSMNLLSESRRSQSSIFVEQQEINIWSLSQIPGTKLLKALGFPEWCVFCV